MFKSFLEQSNVYRIWNGIIQDKCLSFIFVSQYFARFLVLMPTFGGVTNITDRNIIVKTLKRIILLELDNLTSSLVLIRTLLF